MSTAAPTPATAQQVVDQLDFAAAHAAPAISLAVGPVTIALRCDNAALRSELTGYFSECLAGGIPDPDAVIDVLEGQSLDPAPKWQDWAREPGKTGRKDGYHPLDDGRLVHKLRTGMTFLQSETHLVAFGPTQAYPNQIVNFVNTQILNICKRAGWEICHAAAATDGARTLAIAGLSGGGKSTSILRLMDLDQTRFVSNDRLLVHANTPCPDALGVPKHPRINPGTIIGNPKLAGMLTPEKRAELMAMPPEELWPLEDKYDLIVGDIYGQNRVQYAAPLTDFWVLNWSRTSDQPTSITEVALDQRPDLLAAIMKSAGPFYQAPDGQFHTDETHPDPAAYLAALRGVRVSEVTGRVDFDVIAATGQALFDAPTSESGAA